MVGNFPQAFSHVSLVNSAAKVGGHAKPTADHVFLGLARQAMAGTRQPGGTRHLSAPVDPGLRSLVAKVAKHPGEWPRDPPLGSAARRRSARRRVVGPAR